MYTLKKYIYSTYLCVHVHIKMHKIYSCSVTYKWMKSGEGLLSIKHLCPIPLFSNNINHYTQEQVHVSARSWLTYEGDLSSLSCNDLMMMSLWVVCMCRINVDSLTNCRLQWPHFNNGANRWTFLTWRLRSPEK